MYKKLLNKALVFALAVCCMAACLGLAGCDTDSGKEKVPLPTVPVLEDTRSREEKMNTITTVNGDEVTYNMNTRKIVALSNVGDLVAFGIRPSAVITDDDLMELYPGFFAGVESLQYTQPFNAEEIMSYHPELIFVYQNMEADNIASLSQIAPVIPLLRESFDFSERLGYIGEVLGLKENADILIEYAAQTKKDAIAEVERLNLTDKTVSIFYYLQGVSVPPTDFWYFNKIVYDYIGLKRPEKIDEFLETQESPFTPISNEVLYQYEGDIVIYADIMSAGEIPELLQTNEGWMSLKAVRENKVGIIDALLYADKDVLYLYAQYDGILEALRTSAGE